MFSMYLCYIPIHYTCSPISTLYSIGITKEIKFIDAEFVMLNHTFHKIKFNFNTQLDYVWHENGSPHEFCLPIYMDLYTQYVYMYRRSTVKFG